MLELLIKPVSGACQLRCRYCFYHDLCERDPAERPAKMSEETLQLLLRRAFDFERERLVLAFQGGEPTLAGPAFFRRAVALADECNTQKIPVDLVLQTNGLLLDGEWAAFLRERDFLVGVSLDGDEHTHDAARRDRDGNGSYARVGQAISLLSEAGVRFNILTVVNRENIDRPAELYADFRRRGFDHLQFIPCLSPFGEGEDLSPSAAEFGKFLSVIFDLWYRDVRAGRAVHIRQFENYVDMLLGAPPELCGLAGVCAVQNVIETDGSVYPCDFYVTGEYCLGNIRDADFAALRGSEVARRFVGESLPVPAECRACRLYPICRNGCRRYRGEDGKNRLCEGYRAFFRHALPGLADIAAHVRAAAGKAPKS